MNRNSRRNARAIAIADRRERHLRKFAAAALTVSMVAAILFALGALSTT